MKRNDIILRRGRDLRALPTEFGYVAAGSCRVKDSEISTHLGVYLVTGVHKGRDTDEDAGVVILSFG